MAMSRINDILEFWFSENVVANGLWFKANPDFDRSINDNFASDHARAREGDYDDWQKTPEGTLALLIALDQFPRNLFRHSPFAFAADEKAQAIATLAVDRGYDQSLEPLRRVFMYMPFEHAESLPLQQRSIQLFGGLTGKEFEVHRDFAKRHHELIKRFGRFPHRNAVLGRISTAEELAYLADHPNEFG
jgi:uncharacterized protein (DUF924 family)